MWWQFAVMLWGWQLNHKSHLHGKAQSQVWHCDGVNSSHVLLLKTHRFDSFESVQNWWGVELSWSKAIEGSQTAFSFCTKILFYSPMFEIMQVS